MKPLSKLAQCNLCEWRCGVNRLEGERGVCRAQMPQIAYTMLSETLASYSVTMLGCNFRCMYCNAYRISQYPDAQWFYRDYVEPAVLADEAIARMTPDTDKISFTVGRANDAIPIDRVSTELHTVLPSRTRHGSDERSG